MPNQTEVILGDIAVELTREPVVDNVKELMHGKLISFVGGVHNVKPIGAQEGEWIYPYDEMAWLQIHLNDGRRFAIDLHEVSNQAGWTPDLAGLQTAIEDINTWLATLNV